MIKVSYIVFQNLSNFFCDLGQFWPGLEMGRTGLSDVFFLPKDIEWDGSFVMTEKTLIDTTDIPCQKVII